MKPPRGSLMLEVLLATAIGALFGSALLGYVFITNASTDRAKENTLALWSGQEGLEALQTVAFDSLPLTTTGSLTFSNNQWVVGTNGPEVLPGGFLRSVKVEEVFRDSQCLVVASGGTVDEDSKRVTSEVVWTDVAGRSHDYTLTSLRTRWENPQGSCFAAEQASQVTFNVSGAVFSGGKQLRQVYFTNDGSADVTIDKLIFTWTNTAELDQIFMDTSKVWSSTGPGTPVDSVESGTTIDIEDFVLLAGATAELNKGQFNLQMSGVTLTMTVIFVDGSVWQSPPFDPV